MRSFDWTLTVARQAPLSMGFSRQESWRGLSFSTPGDHPDPGIELGFPTLQADSLPSEPTGKPRVYANIKVIFLLYKLKNEPGKDHKCTHSFLFFFFFLKRLCKLWEFY